MFSSVIIVTTLKGWTAGFRFTGGAEISSLLHAIHIDIEAQPASTPMVSRDSTRG